VKRCLSSAERNRSRYDHRAPAPAIKPRVAGPHATQCAAMQATPTLACCWRAAGYLDELIILPLGIVLIVRLVPSAFVPPGPVWQRLRSQYKLR
jgi:hypothetical protein